MASFVLVHGGWGGGWEWRQVAGLLLARGHAAYRPTLTGLGERVHLAGPRIGLQTHVEDVVNVLEFEDLHDVILCGQSYGGAVVTGVADRTPDRIKRLGRTSTAAQGMPSRGSSSPSPIAPARRAGISTGCRWGTMST